jgi:hypothetical protein
MCGTAVRSLLVATWAAIFGGSRGAFVGRLF